MLLPIRFILVLLLAASSLLTLQPARAQEAATAPLRLVVSIAPLKGLVEPLLPTGSTLTLLIPPGVSEHGYEIPPTTLAELSRADIVIYVGLGLEPQVERFLSQHARPGRQAVEFARAAGIEQEPGDHSGHAHDAEGNCLHASTDPHLWLDPVLAKQLVRAAAEAIRTVLNDRQAGLAAIKQLDDAEREQLRQLDALDQAFSARLAKTQRRTVVVTHDAFGHLAGRYRFETVAIKGLNATEPTPRALEAAVSAIREHGLPVVFVEPQLSPAAAERVARSAGVRVMVLDPLGTGDYFGFMQRNLDALAAAMGVEGESPARAVDARAAAPGR